MASYNVGVQIRLNRFFKNGRALVLAADHRTTIGPQNGLVFKPLVDSAIKNELNGIIVRPSMSSEFIEKDLKNTSLLMYLTGKLDRGVDHVVFNTVQFAISSGADIVCSEFKFGSDGDLENSCACSRISEEAHMLGIPHLITTYVMDSQLKNKGNKAFAHACVIAEELGADIIKIGLPNNKEIMRDCVNSVSVPILIAGGQKDSLQNIICKLNTFIGVNGSGAVIGRNIWGSEDKDDVCQALKRVIFKQ